MPGAKHWLFTFNNPPTNVAIKEVLERGGANYACWQFECATTPHIQGYVEFTARRTLSHVRDLFGPIHWEMRGGTRVQARDYCRKADTRVSGPWELGDWSDVLGGQGKRNDLLECKEMLDKGEPETALARDHFGSYIRYHKAFEVYRNLSRGSRSAKSFVTLLWGTTGTGKSEYIRAHCGDSAFWVSAPSSGTCKVWWDGYEGGDVVLDDFRGGWFTFSFLLRLLDRFPMRVESKGGTIPLCPARIWISSNASARDWYDTSKFDIDPLLRRLDCVLEFRRTTGNGGFVGRVDPFILKPGVLVTEQDPAMRGWIEPASWQGDQN